jgi:uracil-DNA glycosylase
VPASLSSLLADVRACQLCAAHLPGEPRPVIQLQPSARILIASQAPGRKVHETGIPFNDASGDKLRQWLGLTPDQFYDSRLVAIVPMAFCYPGKGISGDLPPRPECAPRWRASLLGRLQQLQLTLVIGQYAIAAHLPQELNGVTPAVAHWRQYWPELVPLPHPSPRNIAWFKRNAWFEQELLPQLQARVKQVMSGTRATPGK